MNKKNFFFVNVFSNQYLKFEVLWNEELVILSLILVTDKKNIFGDFIQGFGYKPIEFGDGSIKTLGDFFNKFGDK